MDTAVQIFTELFIQVYNRHAPWIVYQKRKYYVPWITEELQCLMKERDKWKSEFKRLNIPLQEKQEALNSFKYYRNKVNNRKKYDELEYKKIKYEENKHSAERTWNISKQFMNWKKTGSPHQIKSNNMVISKAYDVAETMNSFFYSKLQNIKSSIKFIKWVPTICHDIMKSKKCKVSLQVPTKHQVMKILRNLSSSKCSAIDGLDNFSLKISSEVILNPIHHIICLSIMQEKFPTEWKKAKVIPLQKKKIFWSQRITG